MDNIERIFDDILFGMFLVVALLGMYDDVRTAWRKDRAEKERKQHLPR